MLLFVADNYCCTAVSLRPQSTLCYHVVYYQMIYAIAILTSSSINKSAAVAAVKQLYEQAPVCRKQRHPDVGLRGEMPKEPDESDT